MEKRIEMSGKEVKRLEVLRRLADGVKTQRRAAGLGLSERQVRRLLRRYEREGVAGLVSRRCGRRSNRRLPDELEDAVLARLRECYADFGPTLAAERICALKGWRYRKRPCAAGWWRRGCGRPPVGDGFACIRCGHGDRAVVS